MAGHAEYFGVERADMVAPDWSLDPKTGRRAPTDAYAFDVPYRDEHAVGDVKQLWEPSRHQHLTVLAAAYAVTGDDALRPPGRRPPEVVVGRQPADAGRALAQRHRAGHPAAVVGLGAAAARRAGPARRSSSSATPRPSTRSTPTSAGWLAFPSRGSSANNHAIAEDAGLLAAACAFDWFPESARWRADALASLDRSLRRNTFGSGINRELASEYHGLVLELGLAAAVEAELAGLAVPDTTWQVLLRMTDALAAVVDETAAPAAAGRRRRRLRPGRRRRRHRPVGLAAGHRRRAVRAARTGGRGARRPTCARRCWRRWSGRRAMPDVRPADPPRPLRRRRADDPAGARGRTLRRDLVPARRRPARLPVDRRARPRRRAVGGGALRRRGRAGRPRLLLLPRRARVAARTSAPRWGTTRWSSTGPTSRRPADRSCGCGTRPPA